MSVQSDLAAAFAEPELTVPVQLGDATARGFLDEAGEMLPAGGSTVQRIGTVLYLPKGALVGLEETASVRIGAVGASSAAEGVVRTVHRIDPTDDGLILACLLGGGR